MRHYRFKNRHKTFYTVDCDRAMSPGGAEVEYFVIHVTPFSVVMAMISDYKVVCVRQHRYPTNEVTIKLLMGNSDNEDLLLAARRELEEETGYRSRETKEIGKFQEANSIAEMWGMFTLHNQRISHPTHCKIRRIKIYIIVKQDKK